MTDPRYYSHLSGTNTVPRSSYSSLENAVPMNYRSSSSPSKSQMYAQASSNHGHSSARAYHSDHGTPAYASNTASAQYPATPYAAGPSTQYPNATMQYPSSHPQSYSSPTPSYNTTQYPASYPFGVAPGPYATQFTTGPAPDLCTSIKQCYNCGTTSTPLWRRDPAMQHILCNACGLYQQLRCEARPQVLIDAYNDEGEEEPPPIRADGPQCSECGTRKTSVWRRNKDGEQVCNACGVYYRVNGRPRPLTMPQSKVKPRGKHIS
ncbi:hypothetical protein K438DRAFT_1983307 [Mycena galopus ATCC 62051]|nr:hypothetical protein K438DRAFT_1983307 [Mycena galopus ATCC 62051]